MHAAPKWLQGLRHSGSLCPAVLGKGGLELQATITYTQYQGVLTTTAHIHIHERLRPRNFGIRPMRSVIQAVFVVRKSGLRGIAETESETHIQEHTWVCGLLPVSDVRNCPCEDHLPALCTPSISHVVFHKSPRIRLHMGTRVYKAGSAWVPAPPQKAARIWCKSIEIKSHCTLRRVTDVFRACDGSHARIATACYFKKQTSKTTRRSC